MQEHEEMVRAILAHENLSGIHAHTRMDELASMSTEEVKEIYQEVVS